MREQMQIGTKHIREKNNAFTLRPGLSVGSTSHLSIMIAYLYLSKFIFFDLDYDLGYAFRFVYEPPQV